ALVSDSHNPLSPRSILASLAVGLLVTIAGGVAVYHLTQRRETPSATSNSNAVRAAITEQPRALNVEPPRESRVAPADTTAPATTSATTSKIKPAPSLSQLRTRPRISIHDGDGKPVPVLEAIANNSYPKQRLNGTLRETLQRSDDLQGIISSHLTLEIVITDISGVTVDALVLETRGVGFTEDAAHNQAQERLALSLRETLRQRTQ
ncbi:MAG TPA: hypothetical protein VFQ06_04350, partial [Nitrospira sp.]|nr:hypothetical protein [Nitrospira sp.]